MALHFTTIPCEPITALRHKESHILAILFTVLTAFCARFEALKTFLYVFINEFFLSFLCATNYYGYMYQSPSSFPCLYYCFIVTTLQCILMPLKKAMDALVTLSTYHACQRLQSFLGLDCVQRKTAL